MFDHLFKFCGLGQDDKEGMYRGIGYFPHLKQIWMELSVMGRWEIKHLWREANPTANWLAAWMQSSNEEKDIFPSHILDDLQRKLFKDVSSFQYERN